LGDAYDDKLKWLSSLETLLQGLGYVDTSQLPPSFVRDILPAVKEGSTQVQAIREELEVQQLLDQLGRIKSEAGDRVWFFWEQFARQMQAFFRAEHVVVFGGGTAGWHCIHAGKSEDKELELPPDWERGIVDCSDSVRVQQFCVALKDAGLALMLQSTERTPRILTKHAALLERHATLLGSLCGSMTRSAKISEDRRYIDLKGPAGDHGILGQDPEFLDAIKSLERSAGSDATIYLMGESGTGKELFARHAHRKSKRGKGPFIAINCSAIPHELIESEMFGHEKGAFTGAYYRKIGRVEQAHGGTLFLDEIGEMPLAFQAKLLRYLQEKNFTRVGGNQSVHSDARIVVATHRDLKTMVAAGDFREDLYYRIHVIPIRIPPLRDRGGDIRLLSTYFFKKYIEKSRASRRQVHEAIFDFLEQYRFPGNVRELENIIQRTVVMAKHNKIRMKDLPGDLLQEQEDSRVPRYRLHPFEKYDQIIPENRETLRVLKKDVENLASSYSRDLERRFLIDLLEKSDWSARKASNLASINRTLFYKLLKRSGIDVSSLSRDDS